MSRAKDCERIVNKKSRNVHNFKDPQSSRVVCAIFTNTCPHFCATLQNAKSCKKTVDNSTQLWYNLDSGSHHNTNFKNKR